MHNISITDIELTRMLDALNIYAQLVTSDEKAFVYSDLIKVIESQTGLSKGGK